MNKKFIFLFLAVSLITGWAYLSSPVAIGFQTDVISPKTDNQTTPSVALVQEQIKKIQESVCKIDDSGEILVVQPVPVDNLPVLEEARKLKEVIQKIDDPVVDRTIPDEVNLQEQIKDLKEKTDKMELPEDQAVSVDEVNLQEQVREIKKKICEIEPCEDKTVDQIIPVNKPSHQEQARNMNEVGPITEPPILDKTTEELLHDPLFDYHKIEIKPEDYLQEIEALAEWDKVVQEYDKLFAEGLAENRSFEELEGKMLELIKEISTSELDLETITLGDPREEGIILDEIFRITEMTVEDTFVREDGIEDIKRMVIRGTGPPESNVFIFIFSTPIMVSTKTDTEGNWTYVLEQELEDGSHEIYVASVDNTGKILARSSPTPFVKEAAAIQVDFIPLPGGEFNALGFFDGRIFSVLIIIFFLIVIVTIILVGISINKRRNILK